MRILHVTPAYFPATYWGGPIFSVLGLNRGLAGQEGVELKVLCSDASGPRRTDRLDVSVDRPIMYSPGYEVYFCRRIVGSEIAPALLSKLFELARWADVIHVTGTYSFVTLPSLVVARMFKRPVVWSPRGALLASAEWSGARNRVIKRIWEAICNMVVSGAKCTLHVTSEAERMWSLRLIPGVASAVVIPNGVDIPDRVEVRDSRDGASGNLRLLFLGRIDKKKGLENLLKALALLDREAVQLEVCGEGDAEYVKSLKSLGSRLGIEGRVKWSGQVNGVNKDAAFGRSDICVVPSYSENFCMVVAEALAHAIPVIASKGTPWQEVEARGCGLWVDNAPDALATAIQSMREMPLASMGNVGRAWMMADFGWDSVSHQMLALYKRL